MGSIRIIKSENGQVLLVAILVSVIALTVGLSVATRTLTNTKVSTEETNSQKALSAAEAGVEQLSKSGSPRLDQTIGDTIVKARSIGVAGKEILVNGGSLIPVNEGADIWLSNYPDYSGSQNYTLTIYWNDKSNTDCTALEIVVLSGVDKDNPDMNRYAYDRCAGSADHVNGFTSAGISVTPRTIQGQTFNRSVTLPAPAITNGLILRVIPIYNSTAIGAISATTDIPAQGTVIESEGTAGNVSRKVRVYKSYPKLPTEFFPYSFFQP